MIPSQMTGDEFSIRGDHWAIKLTIDTVWDFPERTCSWGGYDTFCNISITSPHYAAKGQFPISTGEIYTFYEQLRTAYDRVFGSAALSSYEGNLQLHLTFNNQGHVRATGKFIAQNHIDSELSFDFRTDQSFLKNTLQELGALYRKYGDNMGIASH